MITLTVYQCEHCNKKLYKNKKSCQTHEVKCFYNPKTKSCITCDHLSFKEILIDPSYKAPFSETVGLFKSFPFCAKKIDISNRMTTQCKKHKKKTFEPLF